MAKAVLEYEGTRYSGFQRIPGRLTIQGCVEEVLSRLMGPTTVTGAGRTDAGAHARGQVISFPCTWRRSLDQLQRAMNALLPPDIAVRELSLAHPTFHARHHAVARWYRYVVYNHPTRSPLKARFSHHVPWPLDTDACATACHALMGTHDFSSFATSSVRSTVRTMHHAGCIREGDVVEFDFVISSAFSHLIRRLAAALVLVGSSSPDLMTRLLTRSADAKAPAPLPACGLFLMEVFY